MAHSHPSPSRAQTRRTRVYRILLGAVYLLALAGLILWEYHDHLELGSTGCEPGIPASKSAVHSRAYERLLNWASGESATHVTVIAIPADFEEFHGNLCRARAYTADLLRSIAAQHPAVIVIDKFYSPSSCADAPQPTAELLAAARSIQVPLIIGESTTPATAERDKSCLVRKPQLDFGAANVIHGLTRLNLEAERIPLQWRILPAETEGVKAQTSDSISLAAVKAYDADFESHRRLQTLLSADQHPYANLQVKLPRETSNQLLCDAGTAAMQKRWGLDCSEPNPHLRLLGRVVLIGDEVESDHWPVLDSRMWGFDLQAHYIQAVLSGSYLRGLPLWAGFLTFAGFIFVIEGMPTLLAALVPHWKDHWFVSHAFPHRPYAWIIFWTFFFLTVFTGVALALGYLPPLAVFGDICLVAITRLFLFAAHSTGAPLVQPHVKKGKR